MNGKIIIKNKSYKKYIYDGFLYYLRIDGKYKQLVFKKNHSLLLDLPYGLHYINFIFVYPNRSSVDSVADYKYSWKWAWKNDIAVFLNEEDIHISLQVKKHLFDNKDILAIIEEENAVGTEIKCPMEANHREPPILPTPVPPTKTDIGKIIFTYFLAFLVIVGLPVAAIFIPVLLL
ncbi:MAG: hypothetical protein LUG91_10765 [Ruminococcus sp.]|nr:hypothetical protein [Ruminococcus sp.]